MKPIQIRSLSALAGAAVLGVTLAVPAAAQSLCSQRAGSGVNPSGFACVNDPLIGTIWNSTVDIVTPGANASAVAVFLGGPATGPVVSFGELLCAPPLLSVDLAAGSHSILIPNQTSLLGLQICTQAATIITSPFQPQLQNAIDITIGAVGSQDITVLVLIEGDDFLGTPATPVAGAAVTLQGTDPASALGLSAPTGASGTVTFFGVAGPYSVTAQVTKTFLGTTTRLATSLIDVSPALSGTPPAGTIGVVLFSDFEETPSVDAMLTGTVTNLPPLPGNEFVRVGAVGNGPVDFGWYTSVDPVTGSYSMPIPSGVTIDCFVVHRTNSYQPSSPVKASLLQPGVGPTGSGTTLVQNFDFASPAVVPWNVPVGFAATGINPGLSLSIELLVEDLANGISYDFSIFDGNPGPSSITLPDVTDPNLSAFRIELDADTFDPLGSFDGGQDCAEILTTTPASVSFDLFSLPSILTPPDFSLLTLTQLNDLTVEVLEGSTGSFGTNGLNQFDIYTDAGSSGSPPPGIDQTSWIVFTHPGTTSFDLPPYFLPMFGPFQSLSCDFGQAGFGGFTFDFDAFFDGNLAANLTALDAALTEECSNEAEITVFLSGP